MRRAGRESGERGESGGRGGRGGGERGRRRRRGGARREASRTSSVGSLAGPCLLAMVADGGEFELC